MAVEITEVRIKLMEESGERLQAFCSITFDNCFVIRDLKIIEGANGPFVAMPSRKLTAHCPQCGCKNHLKAAYCNQCGLRMKDDRTVKDEEGRTKLYADIAHPINSACREMIQERVIGEFQLELDRAKQPGYVSRYDDFDHEETFPAPQRAPGQSPIAPSRSKGPAPSPSKGPAPSRSKDGYSDRNPARSSDRSGDRPPQRSGQAAYVRPGSESASQVQPAERQPPAPHKATAAAMTVAAATQAAADSSSTSTPADGVPAATVSPKSDAFGAGIF
jgi:stage V sporulation protein G